MNYLPQRESVTPTIAEKVLTFLAPKLGNLVKQTLGWSNNSDIIPASGVHDHSNLSVQAMVYPGVQPVRRLPFPPDQPLCVAQPLHQSGASQPYFNLANPLEKYLQEWTNFKGFVHYNVPSMMDVPASGPNGILASLSTVNDDKAIDSGIPCVLYDDLTGLSAEEVSGLPQRVPHFPQCSLNSALFKPDLVKFLSPLKMLLPNTSQLFTIKLRLLEAINHEMVYLRSASITVPFMEISDGSPFHYEKYDTGKMSTTECLYFNNIPAEEDSIIFQFSIVRNLLLQ